DLKGVVAFTPDRVLGVGSRNFVQWNQLEWNMYSFPFHSGEYANIESVTALSENDLWAVSGGDQTVIYHGMPPCKLPPSAPSLIAPTDGAVSSEVRPTFHVSTNENTEEYHLE